MNDRIDASGNAVGAEFQVNTFTTSWQFQDLSGEGVFGQYYPTVASASGGRFVVAWAGQDGSSFGIFGQRYLSDVIFRDGFEVGT